MEGTKHTSHARPRFRPSRRSGLNLQMSRRWGKRSRKEGKRVSFPGPPGVRLFRNRNLFEDYLLPSSGTLSHCSVIRRRARRNLKGFYGSPSGSAREKGLERLRSVKKGYSRLGPLENRVPVLLHRGGFVNSIRQGRRWVSAGRVQLERGGVRSPVKTGELSLKGGDLLIVDYDFWSRHGAGEVKSRLGATGLEYPLAPYLEVDLERGVLCFVREPLDGEVLVPRGLELDQEVLGL